MLLVYGGMVCFWGTCCFGVGLDRVSALEICGHLAQVINPNTITNRKITPIIIKVFAAD